MASKVLPQPALPQTRVGRPRGSPPPVISSRPVIPVGAFSMPPAGEEIASSERIIVCFGSADVLRGELSISPHHPGPLLPISSQHPSPGEEGDRQTLQPRSPLPVRGEGRRSGEGPGVRARAGGFLSLPHPARIPAGRRQIALRDVVHHHAVGVVAPGQGAHGALDAAPSSRGGCPRRRGRSRAARPRSPAPRRGPGRPARPGSRGWRGSRPSPMAKPLPPSYPSAHQPSRIEQLSTPLRMHFWPLVPHASSGRRGVLSQTSTPCTSCRADVHGVVLDEHDPAGEARVLLQVRHPLRQGLAAGVARMGLAGEDDLHRPLGVVDQPVQAVEVLEQQVGPLVGGEAAGEAQGQRLGRRAARAPAPAGPAARRRSARRRRAKASMRALSTWWTSQSSASRHGVGLGPRGPAGRCGRASGAPGAPGRGRACPRRARCARGRRW